MTNVGWTEVGGTSASSPIIASVYALAGTPAAGTYPASYPYAHTADLYDVTTGINGACKKIYLCEPGRATTAPPAGAPPTASAPSPPDAPFGGHPRSISRKGLPRGQAACVSAAPARWPPRPLLG